MYDSARRYERSPYRQNAYSKKHRSISSNKLRLLQVAVHGRVRKSSTKSARLAAVINEYNRPAKYSTNSTLLEYNYDTVIEARIGTVITSVF